MLAADLVVPLMVAEPGGLRTAMGTAARLGDGTLVPSDLMIVPDGAGGAYLDGAPLLAVEVVSEASRVRDFGAKMVLYAGAGVPWYWVVDPGRGCAGPGEGVRVHVFRLDGHGYTRVASVGWGEAVRLTEPFEIEIRPDALFRGLPAWRGPVEGAHMSSANGPDLPAADEAFDVAAFFRRWPTGAEKIELHDGSPVFYGRWDERDVATAQRAYPGRVIRLDQPPGEPGTLTVLPAAPGRALPPFLQGT